MNRMADAELLEEFRKLGVRVTVGALRKAALAAGSTWVFVPNGRTDVSCHASKASLETEKAGPKCPVPLRKWQEVQEMLFKLALWVRGGLK